MASDSVHTVPVEGGFSHWVKQGITLLMVVAPFAGIVVMGIENWPFELTGTSLIVAVSMHLIAGAGITVGFHRLFTHRSFEAWPFVRVALAVAGSLAVEGPVINWVADHNKHHVFTDEEGDPHSPHVGFGAGVIGIFRGLVHAQFGWLFTSPQADRQRYAAELLKDPGIVWVSRLFPLFAVSAFAIPFGIGWAVYGNMHGALAMTFWAGLMRMGFTHHVTWSINSVCHMFGTRPFKPHRDTDRSTNFIWLALPTLGESLHHNHHVFPTSAYHGMRFWERALDPSGWIIWLMDQLGLVWGVKYPSRERWEAKLADRLT